MSLLHDNDVDLAGYDNSDNLHRPEHWPSLRGAHSEEAIKRSKNVTKSSQCVFPYLPALRGAPSWFQLIKRRFEDNAASNRTSFSWWKIIIDKLRTLLIQSLFQNLYDDSF